MSEQESEGLREFRRLLDKALAAHANWDNYVDRRPPNVWEDAMVKATNCRTALEEHYKRMEGERDARFETRHKLGETVYHPMYWIIDENEGYKWLPMEMRVIAIWIGENQSTVYELKAVTIFAKTDLSNIFATKEWAQEECDRRNATPERPPHE